MDTYESFQHAVIDLLSMPMNFFSGMKSKEELGILLNLLIMHQHTNRRAKFLKLLQDGKYE